MSLKFWNKSAIVEVAFVGGFCDGHRQRCEAHLLKREVALPISSNLLAGLTRSKPSPRDTVSGVARYRLVVEGGTYRYVYQGRTSVEEFLASECEGV